MHLLLLATFASVVDLASPLDIQRRNSACYDRLGCFSTDPPFTSAQRPLSFLPQSPDTIRTNFLLFTREKRTIAQSLDPRYPETLDTAWTRFKRRPTKFIVHGFLDNLTISLWMQEMKDELLTHGDYNVVLVDWFGGNLPPYTQATANTRVVGAQIADVVNEIIKTKGIKADSFHIIGLSLGAHICGYAGERIPGLGRITGLDPAGPYFKNTDPVVRLDPSDAAFVDVIHSDAKSLLQLGLGMKEPAGHMDFYPNLGYDQPGCNRDPVTKIIDSGFIEGTIDVFICDHVRAMKYFKESINSQCPFLAVPCNSEEDFQNNRCRSCTSAGCASMGFNSSQHIPPNGQQVKYYLTTADEEPFCRYHLDVTLKLANGQGQAEKGTASVIVNGDKGSSSEISLTGGSDPVTFSPGNNYTFYTLAATDVGRVRSVTFSWSHSASLTNLLDILGRHDHKLFLDGVDVYSLEHGAQVRLCPRSHEVESGQSLTLDTIC